MATSHVVGGGAAAFIGVVAVSVVNHFFHSHVSDADALVIGAAVASAGAGIGRAVEKVGVFGIFKHFLHGDAAPVPSARAQVAAQLASVSGSVNAPVVNGSVPPSA